MATRDFRAETKTHIKSNLADPDPSWDGFTDWLEEICFDDVLAEDLANFDSYMATLCEINDYTASEIDKIWEAVHTVEKTYANKFCTLRTEIVDNCSRSLVDAIVAINAETRFVFTEAAPLIRLSEQGTGEPLTLDDVEAQNEKYYDVLIALYLKYLNGEDGLSMEDCPLTPEQIQAAQEEFAKRGDPLNNPNNYISSFYGYRDLSGNGDPRNLTWHSGIDLIGSAGDPIEGDNIYSIWDGEIVGYKNGNSVEGPRQDGSYGNYVMLKLDTKGPNGEDVFVMLAHMKGVGEIEIGDTVVPGCLLGQVGNTGTSSGPHLHIEVRVGENSYADNENPSPYLGNQFENGTVMRDSYAEFHEEGETPSYADSKGGYSDRD